VELAKLTAVQPFSSPGIVEPFARELLGLTPAERQSLEETLHRHFLEVEARRANLLYETNSPASPSSQTALATTTFVTPDLGDDAKQLAGKTIDELHRLLGEERWPLIDPMLKGRPIITTVTLESILTGDVSWPDQFTLSVERGDKEPRLVITFGGGGLTGYESHPLSIFLPDGDPGKTDGADRALSAFSELLRQRVLTWAQEQAIALTGKKEKP
jgi:hypothetical protein